MDKVKAQATQIAQKSQEAAREGKARIDQAQANRHADTLLRNLGALVYAEHTGRAAADSQDQIARLIAEISAHEAENGINLSAQSQAGYPGGVPQQGAPGGQAGPGAAPGGPSASGSPFTDPGASSFPQSGGDNTSFPQSGTGFPPESGSAPQ
jgi:hypothetical protein